MRRTVIGQIMRDEKIITGTGFLVKPDIVMTVKHNVLKADDLISDEFEEKEVIFRIAENDEVKGRTINLKESIENGIDCVFIRLEEVLSEDEMYELVDVDNEIEGIECHITGFPKLISGKSTLSATVSKIQQEKMVITVKKEDQLQSYEGLSGAPVVVLGNIIGIIIRQENSEKVEALSIKYINETLKCDEVSVKKKEIPVGISEEKFNISNLKQKIEQIICKKAKTKSSTES